MSRCEGARFVDDFSSDHLRPFCKFDTGPPILCDVVEMFSLLTARVEYHLSPTFAFVRHNSKATVVRLTFGFWSS